MVPYDETTDVRELVFAAPAPGEPRGHEDTVLVRRTRASGPGGHPVYCDETGIVRAEISDGDEVRMLASGAHQDLRRPVSVRRLPRDADAA
ncbi:DUF6296 family protein [Streptacidiphilus sp. N1-12]|uniref:DUF6296 family protein n=2 Tax=Streptacidiphilus alkalitolerans TaxID=3342712 RepID=A0ABV6WN84_9ACTN